MLKLICFKYTFEELLLDIWPIFYFPFENKVGVIKEQRGQLFEQKQPKHASFMSHPSRDWMTSILHKHKHGNTSASLN